MIDRVVYLHACLERLSQDMAVSDDPLNVRLVDAIRDRIIGEGIVDSAPSLLVSELDDWSNYYFGINWHEIDHDSLDEHVSVMHPETAASAFKGLMKMKARLLDLLLKGVAVA